MAIEHFPVAYLGAALEGRDFPMSLGEQVRDFIDVRDVAKAFVSALYISDTESGIARNRNLGTGNAQTLCKFAENTCGGNGENPVNCVSAFYPTARMS